MIKHYLMIKTHNKTGLKYLCKTATNNKRYCFYYLGSGTYWKRHLKLHGRDVSTEIIEECNTSGELIQKGIYWSEKLDVVKSELYANLVPEKGDGGPTMLGRKITPEQKLKQSIALRAYRRNMTPEQKEKRAHANRMGHVTQIYVTPAGEFVSTTLAAIPNNVGHPTVGARCRNADKTISCKKFIKLGWKDKTWRELGWYIKPLVRDRRLQGAIAETN